MELSCMIKNKKYIDAGVKDARMIDYTSKICYFAAGFDS